MKTNENYTANDFLKMLHEQGIEADESIFAIICEQCEQDDRWMSTDVIVPEPGKCSFCGKAITESTDVR